MKVSRGRRLLAVVAIKGGCGKTVSAGTVGRALAEMGRSVLLVDADPTGALAATLGVEAVEGPTLAAALEGRADLSELRPTPGRATVVPPGRELEAVETDLSRDPIGAVALARVLDGVRAFDWIVIDTAPGRRTLSFGALVAADLALVPVGADFLGARTLLPTLETIARARDARVNPRLRVAAVLPTLAGRRTRHLSEVCAELPRIVGTMKASLGGTPPVLAPVPRSVEVAEAALLGRTVLDVAPRSEAAREAARVYRELAALLDRR